MTLVAKAQQQITILVKAPRVLFICSDKLAQFLTVYPLVSAFLNLTKSILKPLGSAVVLPTLSFSWDIAFIATSKLV